ncbi:MAG: HAD family hydrolase [Acidobacteria bacterium]|nr:HAD family hydrolase [Acidobacteriota bacterium]
MKVQFKLAVFDMAGTTVAEGGAVYRALANTLQERGVSISQEDLHQVKGTDKREALQTLVESSPLSRELIPELPAMHERFVERLIHFYQTDPTVTEVEGTSDTFNWLRQNGIKVALNTGFNRQIAQVLIDRLGWERLGLIDSSITSDEVERGRPYPFMIARLMDRLNIADPGMVIKIGDAPSDLQEGYHSGCGLVIGVLGGSSTREQLEIHPHNYLIDSVARLPELISKLTGGL